MNANTARQQDRTLLAVLGWAAAAVVAVGTFFPMASSTMGAPIIKNTLVQSGDGFFFLIGAAVIAFRVWRSWRQDDYNVGWLAWTCVWWSGWFIYDVTQVKHAFRVIGTDQSFPVSAGVGFYVVGLGIAMAIAATIGLYRTRPEARTRPRDHAAPHDASPRTLQEREAAFHQPGRHGWEADA